MRDIKNLCENMKGMTNVNLCNLSHQDLATGVSSIEISIPSEIFYDILNKETGFNIKSEADLIPILSKYSSMEKDYERFTGALEQVYQTGYGIVMPTIDELTLAEPEIVKQGGKYGVKLNAKAPSIHIKCIKKKYKIIKRLERDYISNRNFYRNIIKKPAKLTFECLAL